MRSWFSRVLLPFTCSQEEGAMTVLVVWGRRAARSLHGRQYRIQL